MKVFFLSNEGLIYLTISQHYELFSEFLNKSLNEKKIYNWILELLIKL